MTSTPQKHPDVLGEILLGTIAPYPHKEVDKLNDLIRVHIPETVTLPEPEKNFTHKKKTKKKKSTLYLSESIFKQLADAKDRLRDLCPKVKKSKITKSSLVNQALLFILEDFGVKGEKSILYKKVIQKEGK